MQTTSRLPHANRFTTWFPDFLRKELAPYPGRGSIVARMVISATISAVLIITFRIPGGAIGVLCAFILSRENILSTARSALYIVIAFVIGGLFIPIGARFFASVPITHFLWEAVSLFTVFFLLKTLVNFAIATGLSLVATNILSIWYLPGPAERNVELTLWQVAAALLGALVTLLVELIFHAVNKRDELIDGLEARLKAMEDLMASYAQARPIPSDISSKLAQYGIVGVGNLRRHIAHNVDERIHRMRMSALVSLTGRSVDFAAALSSSLSHPNQYQQKKAEDIGKHITDIRQSLRSGHTPAPWKPDNSEDVGTPLMSELEDMLSLIPSVLTSESTIDPRLDILELPSSTNHFFVEDAFSNPEYIRYALSGTLAAMACYILYVSLAWPGISTSVTTCVLTALTNVGTSRQKQVLRIAGALLGGFLFGMGSQIFILPNIDSISGFVVLFATVSGIAAWVSTSSSRLSYAGLQIALAFYLINLSEFSIQTSLSVARDRAIGVLLGILMMWLVFERFYPHTAADEMVRIFIQNLRLMASLIKAEPGEDEAATIIEIRRRREQIYRYFGDVNAQADAVPFEIGSSRAGDLAARDRIRHWQASLRTFYLLEAPLIQFRIFGNANKKSKNFVEMEDVFRRQCFLSFQNMADTLEIQLQGKPFVRGIPNDLSTLLNPPAEIQKEFSERERALLELSRKIASLVEHIQHEVVTEALHAVQ